MVTVNRKQPVSACVLGNVPGYAADLPYKDPKFRGCPQRFRPAHNLNTKVHLPGQFYIGIRTRGKIDDQRAEKRIQGASDFWKRDVNYIRIDVDNVQYGGAQINRRFERRIHYHATIHIRLIMNVYGRKDSRYGS